VPEAQTKKNPPEKKPGRHKRLRGLPGRRREQLEGCHRFAGRIDATCDQDLVVR
jgi:hypothetical protein